MQMPENQDSQRDEALESPASLVAALRTLRKEPVFIPPTVDEVILRAARRHLVPPKERRLQWFYRLRWAAAGSVLILLLALMPQLLRKLNTPLTRFEREDLNR